MVHFNKAGAGTIAPKQRLLLCKARDPHGFGAEVVFPMGFVFAEHSTRDAVRAERPLPDYEFLTTALTLH